MTIAAFRTVIPVMHHASLNLDVTFRPSSSANVRGEGSARRETLHGVGPPRWRASTARNPAVTSASAVRNATESLARVKADETIMFDPVPGRQDALNVVYAYPNEYSVGITSLGYQLVWAYLETCELTNVVRRFTDLADPLNKRQRVDLLGFSFSWELDYSNIISMLEDMDIAIDAKDRGEGDPIIFGGGPVLTANPEPYAAWFDCVLVGDGEQLLDDFIRAVHEVVTGGGSRREILCKLCTIPGVYIPQFYEPVYQGVEIVDIKSLHGAPAYVQSATYRGDTLAASTVVSPRMAWENIFMAEVVRSCPEMCRFCMASYLTLPFRAAPLEGSLIPTLERGLEVTDRIGLLGASVTQHPEFPALLEWLVKPERDHVRLSIASVRTNTVTPELAEALSRRGTRSLTIAVESGSQRIRDIVNKKLDQEEIEVAAVNAQAGGLKALKLYGMVGVPGETEQDVDATIAMMLSLKKAAPKLKLTLGCSTFVPKSHTPFQWYGVDKAADKRLKRLEKELRKAGIQFRPESYKWSVVQALLSRGDRRVTEMLMRARDLGDSLSTFKRAAKEIDGMPKIDHYAHGNLDMDTILPWQHIHGPLAIEVLRKHAREAL
jgi:radical SAM superfamily enzyme YgiQ (UPF0313 family)